MSSKFQELLEKVHEIHDIEKAMGVLSWDKETNMPKAGNKAPHPTNYNPAPPQPYLVHLR